MIRADGLGKRFGERRVLRGVDLEFASPADDISLAVWPDRMGFEFSVIRRRGDVWLRDMSADR